MRSKQVLTSLGAAFVAGCIKIVLSSAVQRCTRSWAAMEICLDRARDSLGAWLARGILLLPHVGLAAATLQSITSAFTAFSFFERSLVC